MEKKRFNKKKFLGKEIIQRKRKERARISFTV